jgi:hypothetical protein
MSLPGFDIAGNASRASSSAVGGAVGEVGLLLFAKPVAVKGIS